MNLNLEIHGVAITLNENLLSLLNDIAPKLEAPLLTVGDIETIPRLPTQQDNTPRIIARFARAATRASWRKAKQKVIRIQENTIRDNRNLL